MKISKKALLLIFSTAVISGFSVFLNKYSVSVVNPYIFTFLKNAIVALVLSGLVLTFKNRQALRGTNKKQWLMLILVGLIGGGIPFLLFFKGLSMTSAAQGSFIQKTMFIYVAILAVAFLKEKISRGFLFGMILMLTGSFLSLKFLPVSFGRGDALIFLATIFWAIENIISKKALAALPSSLVAWGRMFFGCVFIFIYLAVFGQAGLLFSLDAKQIIWTALTAILLLGYVLTWYGGLKRVPVSLATAILVFGSPITTFLSLVSGRGLGLRDAASILLIAAGLVFITGFRYIKNYFPAAVLQKNE
jgi:drug/metabolite transporter (DMT)-like permease